MARAYRKPNYLKDLLLAVVVLALVFGVFSAVTPLFSRETKSISPFSFSLGKINADGSVSDSETSLCTDYILCDGLKIKYNTERKADYWVFFYDTDKKYVSNSGKLTSDFEVNEAAGAEYARVFLIPELKKDQTKIRSWEVFSYANALEITIPRG